MLVKSVKAVNHLFHNTLSCVLFILQTSNLSAAKVSWNAFKLDSYHVIFFLLKVSVLQICRFENVLFGGFESSKVIPFFSCGQFENSFKFISKILFL